MIPALIAFGVTYVLLLTFQKFRPYIAIASAVVFSVMCGFNLGDVWSAIDWNVLMMIAGTMGTVYLFIESKMPDRLADIIIDKVPNVKWAIVWLSLFAGIISAFVDNVATVLMIAPVALDISKKLKINPVPMIIAIAVSSNLQGAATLVGDTTSILLGGALDMTFLDFFWYDGMPGLFWVVQAGAVASAIILMWLFRKEKQPLEFPSAGSTFKRPEGYFAGKLIEDAGLKGYRVGDIMVSEKHCGFVVNVGQGTAADTYQLIQDVKNKVYEQFQVELEAEVRIIGEGF